MNKNTNVPIMLTVPKEIKDQLKRLVSTINFKNPDASKTVSGLSREVLESYLKVHSADTEDLVV
jgi:hypothetical protein